MRHLTAPAVALLLVGCSSGCSHRAGRPDPALADPLGPGAGQVIRLEVPDDPTITFKVWVAVGSQSDPAGREGLAHLTAEMIAGGATRENSYEAILAELYPLASSYEMSVDREMTVLTGRTHRDNLDAFFELFTDAYLHPAFDEADFKRLKTDTLNYLENTLRYSEDEELGKAALYDLVFRGTRYAHPPEGTVRGVGSITLDDVKQFYGEHYAAGNVRLAVGGGFDEQLVARFERTLRSLPGSGSREPRRLDRGSLEPLVGRKVLLVDKPGADASISVGFPIDVRRGEREFYALWVANSWFGEHRNSSSHLFQVIRERRGLNYGDYSYIEAFPNGGRRSFPPPHAGRSQQLFEVWVRTLPDRHAHFALRAAVRELKKLVDSGMTREDFELTRSFLMKYCLHFADTTAARLGYAVDDRFYGVEGEGHLARFRKTMAELTLEEVNAAVRKHLQVDRLAIAIVTGDAAGLKESLATDADSPMHYDSAKSAELVAEDEAIASFPLSIEREAIRVVPLQQIFEH